MKFLSKKLVKLPVVGNVTVLKLGVFALALYLFKKSKTVASGGTVLSNYFQD